jgi:DNA-binding NarL/FixJ family response regulator
MINVMICDDHAVVRVGLERLISTFPEMNVVASVPDGQAAVEAVLSARPDVVLKDLAMPGIDGIEATRRVLGAAPDVRVVILTSFLDRERIMGALEAGAIGYLMKDANPEELASGIRAAARGELPIDPKAALLVLRGGPAAPRPAALTLSERETETLALVAQGLPNKQIARRLGIAEKTVKAHLTSIFRRIGVDNRMQAAQWLERQQAGRSDA